MDNPPPFPLIKPHAIPYHPAGATTVSTPNIHLNHHEFIESSPRCLHSPDSSDAATDVLSKLRLMCSYGGHIVPRPHDKILTYVGGETRLIVIDRRHSSLSSFFSRLSRSLLNGRSFTLKYQIPYEDLDSLISVSTDEDLENMIYEHDRFGKSTVSDPNLNRIRLFLFFNKIETAATMGNLVGSAKTETWFVDTLNESGLLPRGLSDSVAVNNFLTNLDEDPNITNESKINNSDSPVLEKNNNNNSSSSSSSSSPSMSNLPPIRVRIEEEKFSQMNLQEQLESLNDGFCSIQVAQQQKPMAAVEMMTLGSSVGQVLPESGELDPGVPVAFRRDLPVLQPLLVQPNKSVGYICPSPDSVASDTSLASKTSLSKPISYQDQPHVTYTENKTPLIPNTQNHSPIPVSESQIEKLLSIKHNHQEHLHQQQQQQFVHYIPQFAPMPSSYYTICPHPHPHQADPTPYPVYVLPLVPQSHIYLSTVAADAKVQSSNHIPSMTAGSTASKNSTIPQTGSTLQFIMPIPQNQFQSIYPRMQMQTDCYYGSPTNQAVVSSTAPYRPIASSDDLKPIAVDGVKENVMTSHPL